MMYSRGGDKVGTRALSHLPWPLCMLSVLCINSVLVFGVTESYGAQSRPKLLSKEMLLPACSAFWLSGAKNLFGY